MMIIIYRVTFVGEDGIYEFVLGAKLSILNRNNRNCFSKQDKAFVKLLVTFSVAETFYVCVKSTQTVTSLLMVIHGVRHGEPD